MRCAQCGRGDLMVVFFEKVGHVASAYCQRCERSRREAAAKSVRPRTIDAIAGPRRQR